MGGTYRGWRWAIQGGAPRRLGIAALAAAVALGLSRQAGLHTALLVSWDVGTFSYLGLAWLLVTFSDARETRDHVQEQDQSGYLIFLFILVAACAGMVAIGFLVGPLKDLSFWPKTLRLTLSVVALVGAWLMIHTVFAFHYARTYYGGGPGRTPIEGLVFPGNHSPDYLDFIYYSLVVGMTSQVSDVVITSRTLRHITMLHAILSFIFNIAVLALAINIIASVI